MSKPTHDLSRSSLNTLDLCIRSGPQRVHRGFSESEFVELQRAHAIMLCWIGAELHAVHTYEGFQIWDADRASQKQGALERCHG